MTTPFVAPAFLREAGPAGFTRQVERLLLHLGFVDVTNIDGPNDQGGDLLATRSGQALGVPGQVEVIGHRGGLRDR